MRRLISTIIFAIFSHVGIGQFNVDFELTPTGAYTASGSVSGWTLSSQPSASCSVSGSWTPGSNEFSVVATPLSGLPVLGSLGNSPIGGSNVIKMNGSANATSVRLTRQFPVPGSNLTIFSFAFAGVIDTYSAHSCCEQASLKVLIRTSQGNVLQCSSYSIAPPGCAGNTTLNSPGISTINGWQVAHIDLTPYFSVGVNIEVVASDCACGLHTSTLFFDAKLTSLFNQWLTPLYQPNSPIIVNYCQGSSVAQMIAPQFYASYQWYGSFNQFSGAIPGATTPVLQINNPAPGNTYTVLMTNYVGCQFVATGTLVHSQVSLLGKSSSETCPGGASGSATVLASGSGTGYNYSWMNSGSVTVSNFSVANNLSPGIYSVIVSAAGSAGCGTAVTTVTIGTGPENVFNYQQPFCGTLAYLHPGAGTNYQWYNNGAAIGSGMGGNAPSYTVTNAIQNMSLAVTYSTVQGCLDSVNYVLQPANGGSLSVLNNKLVCPGTTTGAVTISMSPVPGALPGQNSFHVINANSNTPVYSASISSSTSFTFPVNTLVAGGNYSVTAFDGACFHSTSFSVSPHIWDFALTGYDFTVCPNQPLMVAVTQATGVTGGLTYSWSPNNLVGANSNFVVITPLVAPPGSSYDLTYSVAATPTLSGCMLTKTITVKVANPLTPTIQPIPEICRSSLPYSVSVQPAGGVFSGVADITGIINPGLHVAGIYSVGYSMPIGTCAAVSTQSVKIKSFTFSVSSPTSICSGGNAAFVASGATSYTWNSVAVGSTFTQAIHQNSNISVTAYDAITNCFNPKTVYIGVRPLPLITFAGSTLACAGKQVTLTATGSDNYIWDQSVIGSKFITTATGMSSHLLTGFNKDSCSANLSFFVKAQPLPSISIFGHSSLCMGQAGHIYAGGAASYTWNTGSTATLIPVTVISPTIFSVTGTNEFGCQNSASVSVGVHKCLHKEEINGIDGITVFPNPFVDEIWLVPGVSDVINITLLDANGRTRMAVNEFDKKTRVDLSYLERGLYFLHIRTVAGFRVCKLTKQ